MQRPNEITKSSLLVPRMVLGGPLVCNMGNGPFTLYSIVRWGIGWHCSKKPGAYSRASIFLDWVRLLKKGECLLSPPAEATG